jgi:hypothetical protein
MFNTEISILLNTEKIPILKFNNAEIFDISTENTEPFRWAEFCGIFFCKKFDNFFFRIFSRFSLIFGVFFGTVQYFSVFLGIFRDSIQKMFVIEQILFFFEFFEKKFWKFSGFLKDFQAFLVCSVFRYYRKYK